MELATVQLSRPLPNLRRLRTTQNPSTRFDLLALEYMHPWSSFYVDVQTALLGLDPTLQVSVLREPHHVLSHCQERAPEVGNASAG